MAVLGWAVAAASATGVSLAAIDALGEGITGQPVQPLSPAEVDEALARATAATPATPSTSAAAPTRSGPPTASHPSRGSTRVLTVDGGSLVAHCMRGEVTLRSWSPAPGFTGELKDRGPDDSASIEFESDAQEYRVEVTCDAAGAPLARVAADDRDDGRSGDSDDDTGGD